ncbi:ABC transporter substrate-binding protein [Psychroflexus aestuariivivens]|uniref:ABC transporter substrate-binding protein n=1 Tax=Psychroflexus aestuariivivens TaxID=1795040 RepID=UPI000FD73CE1|nr:helical backbone metal receptor [Psychroflexus aestuariivivens]
MKDQLGRKIQIEKVPQRIISLVPSLTELLVDLGLEDRLVGVTKFCVHPEDLRKKVEVVGGTKDVKIDKVKSLKPDIIIANKEENTLKTVDELSEFCTVHVSDVNNFQDVIDLIQDYAEILEVHNKAKSIIENLQEKFTDFKSFSKNSSKLKVAYFIWRKPWMLVGNGTFINYMLELNNFENAYKHLPRYPEVDINQLEELDFVFLSSEPFPFSEQYFREIPLENSKIVIIDGEYFSWYGTRLLKAFDYFKQLRKKL